MRQRLTIATGSSELVDVKPRSRSSSQSAGDAFTAGTLGLPEATVEAIAHRVAELIADGVREPLRLLDTSAVAGILSVSDDWVRDHAAELGAIRVGDGPKGPLRFEARRVRAALERRRLDRPPERHARRPGPRRRSLGVLPAGVPENVRDW